MDLYQFIRLVPDFPRLGVNYRDITPLLANAQALRFTIKALHKACLKQQLKPDYIVGIESRGFILGTPLALLFGAGFVPVRKAGKLPAAVNEVEYLTEYSKDRLAIHRDAFAIKGAKVLIVDDLLATGGTLQATLELLGTVNCEVIGVACLIELPALKGREKLPKNLPMVSLLTY